MLKEGHQELRKELLKGECLFWAGKPKQGLALRQIDFLFIPFSIFSFVFILYSIKILMQGGVFFFILLSPMTIYMIVVFIIRYVIDTIRRANTTYGITENRLIIISGILSKGVKSINISKLVEIELREKEDKTGTIFLDPKNSINHWNGDAIWWFGRKELEMIKDVRIVYNKLIKIQNSKD